MHQAIGSAAEHPVIECRMTARADNQKLGFDVARASVLEDPSLAFRRRRGLSGPDL
jgi:hypothetical protein